MTENDTQPPYGFSCKQAKRLSYRKDQPYAMLQDRAGCEWLVDGAVDNGRIMFLIQAGTNGQKRKTITKYEYCDFMIILDWTDIDAMIMEAGK